MANIQITQLPAAGPITGTESVPVVQNGVTVRTTTGAIAASPAQTQTFLTLNQEPTLPNSRALQVQSGLTLTDAGAQGALTISLTGAAASLNSAGTGIQVKTTSTTVAARSIAVGTSGLSVADADGVSGNPTLSLTGQVLSLANASGAGIVALPNNGTVTPVAMTGTANQITVTNGTGATGNPTFFIADNPILPGIEGVTLPSGATLDRPASPINGEMRYNTDTGTFEGYANNAWGSISTGGGVTSVATGTGLTGGPITSTGTISIDSTVATLTGAQTLTNKTISGSSNTLSNIANASLTNSSISINGNSVSLGGSTTVTASTTAALTIGTGLSGTSFDGSTAVTIAIDSTVATLTGTQTLTNKSISGSTNTLTDIANASLTNSSVTVGTTAIALGASSLTLGGLTSIAVTQDPTSALQLATKQYVDAVAEGLHVHAACAAATTGTLASITGGTVTYNNGTAGVGATLTLSVALTVLDGYTLLNGDRVLVKDEATQANNGIYTWATGGTVLTRATDFDTAVEMASGDFTFVTNGTLYANTGWVQTDPVTVVGTSPVTWIQFSGAGAYTAGTGLTLTGTQFSITNTAVTAATYGSASQVPVLAVNAQGQLTSVTNTAIAISNTQVSGLGTMSTQNANSVAITGGAIDGTSIGATTPSTVGATTVTTTGAGSVITGAGQIYLNGATSNRIDFNSNGTGAPTFTTRSAGTKAVLFPALSGSQVDYAMGINAATLWSSVPVNSSSFYFKWYGGETEVASLDGVGAFNAIGGISGGTF